MQYNMIISIGLLLSTLQVCAQVSLSELAISVNSDGSAPHPSALLEVKSSEKGFLLAPAVAQVVEQMEGLPEGAMYFDTLGCLHVYKQSAWRMNCSLHDQSHTDPTAPGQIPVQNADGAFNWKSLLQLQEASLEYHRRGFQAYSAIFYTLTATGEFPLQAGWDIDQSFFSGPTDHHYVATEAGYYYLTSTISFNDGNGSDDTIFMRFEVNDQPTHIESLIDPKYFANGGYQSQSISGILYLNARDVVHLRMTDVNQSIVISNRTFSAQKISN